MAVIPFTILAIIIIAATIPTAHTTLARKGSTAICVGFVGFTLYWLWWALQVGLGEQENYPRWPLWWWGGLIVAGLITRSDALWKNRQKRKQDHV